MNNVWVDKDQEKEAESRKVTQTGHIGAFVEQKNMSRFWNEYVLETRQAGRLFRLGANSNDKEGLVQRGWCTLDRQEVETSLSDTGRTPKGSGDVPSCIFTSVHIACIAIVANAFQGQNLANSLWVGHVGWGLLDCTEGP